LGELGADLLNCLVKTGWGWRAGWGLIGVLGRLVPKRLAEVRTPWRAVSAEVRPFS